MVRTLLAHPLIVTAAGTAWTLAAGLTGWSLAGLPGLILAIGFWGPLLAGLLLVVARHRDSDLNDQMRNQQAFVCLTSVLRPRLPLPLPNGWAAMPDLLCYLTERVLADRIGSIVEAGSGTSTLCFGYALEKLGRGRLLALEHDAAFATDSQERVRAHGLENWVTVAHAPLVAATARKPAVAWYDLSRVELPDEIDLLFVDGPPGVCGPLARYPALPALIDRLKRNTIVVLDDGTRRSEMEIIERWRREFQPARVEALGLSRGAWMMTGFDLG